MYSVYTRYMKIHVSTSKQHSHKYSQLNSKLCDFNKCTQVPLKNKGIFYHMLYTQRSVIHLNKHFFQHSKCNKSYGICFIKHLLTLGILKKNVALLLAFLNCFHLQDRGGDGRVLLYIVNNFQSRYREKLSKMSLDSIQWIPSRVTKQGLLEFIWTEGYSG